MGLHDHFRPPLSPRRQWHGFHHAWATYISAELNEKLPAGYFAAPNVAFGIEIDVAALDERVAVAASAGPDFGAEREIWHPEAPTFTLPLPLITDVVEALIYSEDGGPVLAGAIELVSPANKDRPSHRDAFVAKCQAYLQRGLGLVMIDIVTERSANLHRELLERLAPPFVSSRLSDLYAAAYRPVEVGGDPSLNVWEKSLAIGQSLPTMPLWLPGELCVAVDLNASYERTCREQRIPDTL
jgi:hypothetical protein